MACTLALVQAHGSHVWLGSGANRAYASHYQYAYNQCVMIVQTSSGWQMHVEGYSVPRERRGDSTLRVQPMSTTVIECYWPSHLDKRRFDQAADVWAGSVGAWLLGIDGQIDAATSCVESSARSDGVPNYGPQRDAHSWWSQRCGDRSCPVTECCAHRGQLRS